MLPAFFHQTPFFRLLLPFVAGIAAGFWTPVPATLCLVVGAVLWTAMCILIWMWKQLAPRRWGWLYGAVVYLFLFVAGTGTVSLQRHAPPGRTERGLWLTIVEEPPVEKANSMKTTIHITANLSGEREAVHDEHVVAYFRKDSLSQNMQQGDLLVVDAELKPVANAGNPYEFDYRGYLSKKHIGRSVFVESGAWQYLDGYAQSPLLNLSNRIRNTLLGVLERAGLSGNELAVASALVLGYKADLDDELRGAYAASGAMHVLAVSGLHVGIIYLVLGILLNLVPGLKRTKWLRAILMVAALWLYALITGMSPSVMRAATMFSFIAVGEALNRRAYIYNSIAASAFVLLLVNPANLFEVGFQLSYMAVIAIVFFHPHFYSLLSFRRWLPDKAWSLTCVSVAAQIGTVPLALYYFHQFPSYFILTNLIVIPAASVVIYGAVTLFVLSPITTLLEMAGWLFNQFLYVFNSSIFFIEKLQGSVIAGIRFEGWEIVLSYFIVAMISIWVYTTRKAFLFATLALCLLWIAGAAVRDARDLRRQQLIVYHSPGNTLLQFVDGRNNALWYASRNPTFNAPLLTENQRIAMQLNTAHCTPLDSALLHPGAGSYPAGLYADGVFVQFGGQRLVIFTRNRPPQDAGLQSVETDAVLLTQNVNAQIPQIILTYRPEIVVIDASNTPARADRWEKDCREAGVRCHRVDKDGAFVVGMEYK